jgi:two-component system, NarL family, sensor histidine kinase YdfH
MKQKLPGHPEQDYRIFFVFMTLVLIGIYFLSIAENPALQQPLNLLLFTFLMVVHIVLHWMVIPIILNPGRKVIYILGQGMLAFVITYLSQYTGMVFALYMALIGETIGFLGLNRWSVLSTLYYLALSLINFIFFTNFESAVYWLLTIIPTVIFIGMYVTLYLRQADAREKAQALASELEAANRQLTEYAAQVEDLTIANERQRMARELHDTLSQGLAGVILQLEAADAHLTNRRPEKAQTIISHAMEQARITLAEARRAIADLRQSSQYDLESALRVEISRFTHATGIPVHFQTDPIPDLSNPVKETMVRALAEALTNITQHAQAQNVEICTALRDEILSLSVQDDGRGFDTVNIPSGHYGILGIRERVRLVNGTLDIQSQIGKGTTLSIHVPLSQVVVISETK